MMGMMRVPAPTRAEPTLADKLARDSHGDFQPERLKDLQRHELAEWLSRHLRGEDDIVPIVTTRGDRPANAPVAVYRALARSRYGRVLTLLDEALAEVAAEILSSAGKVQKEPNIAFELLDVIERTEVEAPFDLLKGIADEGTLVGIGAWIGPSGSPPNRIDLHKKVLLALSAINYQIGEGFWLRQMEDVRWAEAAFLGLCRMNESRAMAYLPRYAAIVHANRDLGEEAPRFDPVLFYLVDKLGLSRARFLASQALGSASKEAREIIIKAFERMFGTGRDDVFAAAAAPTVDQVAELVVSGTAQHAALLDTVRFVHSIEDRPQLLIFERAFAKYIAEWRLHPTLDCTSLALHCLREVGALEEWLSERKDAVIDFVRRCLSDRGFAIAETRVGSPSLYATANGIGAIKALAGLGQGTSMSDHRSKVVDAVGEELVRDAEDGARALLAQLRDSEGLPMDEGRDGGSTIHALDAGITILWNLDRKHPAGDLDRARIHDFVAACRHEQALRGGRIGAGFVSKPPPPSGRADRSPCSTTTSLVLRIYDRAGWWSDLPAERDRIVDFLLSMFDDEQGGFRVFQSEQPTVSATFFSLEALAMPRVLGEDWRGRVDVEKLNAFIEGCRRDHGFSFSRHSAYPSVHSTRYAFGAVKRLYGADGVARERDLVLKLATTFFDPGTGGFFGIERPLAEGALDSAPAPSGGFGSVAAAE